MIKMKNEKNKKYMGILCIICSAFFFALMNMFVRMAGDLPSIQKSFFRNLIAFFFAFGYTEHRNFNMEVSEYELF